MNPFIALHRGLNVLPIASTFKALRVKNFAAMMYSLDSRFFPSVILSPSLSSNESFVHCLDKSSITTRTGYEKIKREGSNNVIIFLKKGKKKINCFPNPLKE